MHIQLLLAFKKKKNQQVKLISKYIKSIKVKLICVCVGFNLITVDLYNGTFQRDSSPWACEWIENVSYKDVCLSWSKMGMTEKPKVGPTWLLPFCPPQAFVTGVMFKVLVRWCLFYPPG